MVTVIGPGAALAVSAAAVLTGVTIFVSVLPDERREVAREDARGLLGVLRVPGITTLVLTMFPVGFAFGALEVSVPAFSLEESRPELAGVLLAIWAIASAAGGFVYGVRPRRSPLAVVHHRLTLLLPLAFVPPLLAPSIPVMALILIPAGVLIAPDHRHAQRARERDRAAGHQDRGADLAADSAGGRAFVGRGDRRRADRQLRVARSGAGRGRRGRRGRHDRDRAARERCELL